MYSVAGRKNSSTVEPILTDAFGALFRSFKPPKLACASPETSTGEYKHWCRHEAQNSVGISHKHTDCNTGRWQSTKPAYLGPWPLGAETGTSANITLILPPSAFFGRMHIPCPKVKRGCPVRAPYNVAWEFSRRTVAVIVTKFPRAPMLRYQKIHHRTQHNPSTNIKSSTKSVCSE